jgi:hypothetical protein
MVEKRGMRSGFARYSLIFIALLAVLYFLLRGPYLSNYIKRILIPQLENATRERVLIEKAVINLFPFYIQAKGLKMFDAEGNRLLWITKARAYIDLTALVSREIRIRKLTMKEPDLTVKKADIDRMREHMRERAKSGEKGYRFSIRNIFLTDCNFVYEDPDSGLRISEQGFDARMTTRGGSSEIDFFLDDIVLGLSKGREFRGKLKVQALLRDDAVEIETIDLMAGKSSIRLEGDMLRSDRGGIEKVKLQGKARVTADLYNSLLDLESGRSGEINVEGTVRISDMEKGKSPLVNLDIKTDSHFFLESLMEVLHVREKIGGEISVVGKIQGTYPDIVAHGTLHMNDGLLGGLPLDDIVGELKYSDNKFRLSGFTGRVFTGGIKGDGFVSLPHGDYGVTAEVSGVDSPDFFRFIHWQPPFPNGIVEGDFTLIHNRGQDLDLVADVIYKNTTAPGGAVHKRLKGAHVSLQMNHKVITFSDAVLDTGESEVRLRGDIDLREKEMALDIEIHSSDVRDLTSPFYENLSAPVAFSGSMTGPLNDPVIIGRAVFGAGHIHGNAIDMAQAEFSYSARQLELKSMKTQKGDASCEFAGSIRFRKSKGLFDFSDPYYIGKGSCEALPASPLIASLYRKLPVSATASGSFEFEGNGSEFRAPAEIDLIDINAYGHPIDRLNIKLEINPDSVRIREAEASRGDSTAEGRGVIYFDGKIDGAVGFQNLNISDIFKSVEFPVEGKADIRINWSGTLEAPVAEFEADIGDLIVRERSAGGGSLRGSYRDGRLSASGTLADKRIELKVTADLPETDNWSADITLKDGRYDFIAAGFFETLPDDFSLRSEGRMSFRSANGKLTMNAVLERLNLGVYDYMIKNSGDIELEMLDDRLYLKSFSFVGNRAELTLSGSMIPGKEFDLRLDGDINIMPLKVLSRELVSLSGRAVAGIEIRGEWNAPEMFGEFSLFDVYASVSSRQKIGPIDGTFFLKKDRVSFESVTAGFAGGVVTMSGEGRFAGIRPHRMYVNLKFDDVRLRHVEGLKATVNGSLFYELSSKGSSLTGSLELSRARYEKDVDWKRWLVGLKDMNNKSKGYAEFLRNTELNIRLSGSDDIAISNNLLKAPIDLDINIIGKPESIGIIGRIGADSGTLFFRGNEFRVLEGTSVDFIDPRTIKPLFHIVSETYRDDYHIRLSLDGTVEEFSLSLFSDPPLSEQEILTLLTFGGLGSGSRGFDTGIATEEATSILTGGLRENIEEEIKSITGFERISIEPHTTSTGAFTSRVTVARRLLEDRIRVIYSTSIGSSEEQLIKVEYRLSDEWSIVGSRDELGSTGGDIKFRFEFR